MLFPYLTEYNDTGLFILRIAIGIIFLYHGVPKLKNPKAMAAMMGMPNMAMGPVLLGLVEILSALGLVLGFLVQLSALLLGVVMVGAIFMKVTKWRVPFGAMDKTGWEFDLILLAANLAVLLSGGGSVAIQQ